MNTSKNNTSSLEGLPNKFMDYWKVEEKFQFEKATRKDCVSTQILQNIVRFSIQYIVHLSKTNQIACNWNFAWKST